MGTKKVQLHNIKNSKGKTNKKEVDSLTDLQINEAAMSDPDAAILTNEELKEFKKVGKKDIPRIKKWQGLQKSSKKIYKLKGKTNWAQLKQQTEDEINNAALSDPDAKLLKDHELMNMKKSNK